MFKVFISIYSTLAELSMYYAHTHTSAISRSVSCEHTHTHLLAQNDSVLQALLEAVSDSHPRHLFYPEPQLLLLLYVILLSDLRTYRNIRQTPPKTIGVGLFSNDAGTAYLFFYKTEDAAIKYN